MMATSPAPPQPQFARLKDESPVSNIDPEDELEDVESVRTSEVDCSLSEWGEWSDCSSECDRGTRLTKLDHFNIDTFYHSKPFIQ